MGREQGRSAAITIPALPPSADNLLLSQVALALGIANPAIEHQTLAAIRTAAARYPGDPYARRVLAAPKSGRATAPPARR